MDTTDVRDKAQVIETNWYVILRDGYCAFQADGKVHIRGKYAKVILPDWCRDKEECADEAKKAANHCFDGEWWKLGCYHKGTDGLTCIGIIDARTSAHKFTPIGSEVK